MSISLIYKHYMTLTCSTIAEEFMGCYQADSLTPFRTDQWAERPGPSWENLVVALFQLNTMRVNFVSATGSPNTFLCGHYTRVR